MQIKFPVHETAQKKQAYMYNSLFFVKINPSFGSKASKNAKTSFLSVFVTNQPAVKKFCTNGVSIMSQLPCENFSVDTG